MPHSLPTPQSLSLSLSLSAIPVVLVPSTSQKKNIAFSGERAKENENEEKEASVAHPRHVRSSGERLHDEGERDLALRNSNEQKIKEEALEFEKNIMSHNS
jgi:hypothetical protein